MEYFELKNLQPFFLLQKIQDNKCVRTVQLAGLLAVAGVDSKQDFNDDPVLMLKELENRWNTLFKTRNFLFEGHFYRGSYKSNEAW